MAQSSDGFGRAIMRNGQNTNGTTKHSEKTHSDKPLSDKATLTVAKKTLKPGTREKKSSPPPGLARAENPHAPSAHAPSAHAPSAHAPSAHAPSGRVAAGVAVARRNTSPDIDPLDAVVYERRSSVITNPDGSIVFKMEGAEIPAGWSQLATDIVISKYFRKAGLHGDKDQGETSVRQVVHRLAHTIRDAGESFGGYFATQGRRRHVRGRALVPARQPVRRLQLAGLVQLRALARVRDHGLGRQLGVGRGDRRRSPRRRTPTSARSARRASSSRRTTT